MCILAWSLSENVKCLVGLQGLFLKLFILLLGHNLKMPYVWSTNLHLVSLESSC
jgi:hypothetical protein